MRAVPVIPRRHMNLLRILPVFSVCTKHLTSGWPWLHNSVYSTPNESLDKQACVHTSIPHVHKFMCAYNRVHYMHVTVILHILHTLTHTLTQAWEEKHLQVHLVSL